MPETSDPPRSLEDLHPSLWRASQLGRAESRCIDTGFLPLSKQLPGKGWPTGAVVELLVQQPGAGEIRLLAPALASVASRTIVLIDPPHTPNALAFAGLGIEPGHLLWLQAKSTANMLFSAETVLKSGSFGAVLLWANQIRQESIRRLNLAAQTNETLFFLLRPLSAAQDQSPSPLRLSLRPAASGIEIGFVKRRGARRDEPLYLPLTGPHTSAPDRFTRPPGEPAAAPAEPANNRRVTAHHPVSG